MQPPLTFDPNQPFYFTQAPPPAPMVKRGSWTLPLIATAITAIDLMFTLGQPSDSHSQPAGSTPSPSPTTTPAPTGTPIAPSPQRNSPPAIASPSPPIAASPSHHYSPFHPQDPTTLGRTETGLPWNANVRLTETYRVLEVHSLPSAGAQIIGILEQGDAVRILTPPITVEGTPWVNIQKGGYSGWVLADSLEIRP